VAGGGVSVYYSHTLQLTSMLMCAGVGRPCGWWGRVRLLLAYITAAILQLHTRQDVRCVVAKSHGRANHRVPN